MRALLVALVLLALPPLAQARVLAVRWMPVATYLNDPAHEAQADRVRAEVEAHGIRTATTCSAGCALSVAQSRAMEAIQIVDAVVTREHLDVSVVVPPTS